MFKKSFGSFFLAIALCFSMVPTSLANTTSPNDDAEDISVKIPIEIQSQLLSKFSEGSNPSVTITDESELKRIAAERGLEEIPAKIEYEYVPAETDSTLEKDIISPFAKGQVCYVQYMEDVYFPSQKYNSFLVDGPDTFIIDETKKFTSSFTSTLGASSATLQASLGFTVGSEHSVRFISNTPVKSNERVTFNLHVIHSKYKFAVDDGNVCTFAYAYKPVGTFIEKITNYK